MDLRTKLIFAFVVTALASMLLLGWFSYVESRDMLRDSTARQLETLASARVGDLAVIVQGLQNEVRLIRSRTRLRQELAAYPRRPASAAAEIQQILEDAESSVGNVTGITVFDVQGQPIARAGRIPDTTRFLGSYEDGVTRTRFYEDPALEVTVETRAPLEFEGEVVGDLASQVAVGRLVSIAGEYEGLGDTGEMLLVAEFAPGRVTFLNPFRHSTSDRLPVLAKDEVSEAVRMALAGEDGFLEGMLDYRGVRVWAAVEGMPEYPVGLIVKVDEEEELAPIRELRDRLLRVGLSVAALAILTGALVGALLARPVRDLREVVQGIRDGDTDLRADIGGEDEVSFLAESFNKLMDDVQRSPPKGGSDGGES